MGDVIDIRAFDQHFAAVALCCQCHHKWIAVVHPETSLFKLECPVCEFQDSFAAVLPMEYLVEAAK